MSEEKHIRKPINELRYHYEQIFTLFTETNSFKEAIKDLEQSNKEKIISSLGKVPESDLRNFLCEIQSRSHQIEKIRKKIAKFGSPVIGKTGAAIFLVVFILLTFSGIICLGKIETFPPLLCNTFAYLTISFSSISILLPGTINKSRRLVKVKDILISIGTGGYLSLFSIVVISLFRYLPGFNPDPLLAHYLMILFVWLLAIIFPVKK